MYYCLPTTQIVIQMCCENINISSLFVTNTLFIYLLSVSGSVTACLVQWLAHPTAIQEVPGSIPSYTLEIFLEIQGLERGPPSLVRTTGQLLDMRSSEIRLRKLKLRFRDNSLLTTGSLYYHLAATASVGLGSSEFKRHGFNLILIVGLLISSNQCHIAE